MYQFLLGTDEQHVGSVLWLQRQRYKGEVLLIFAHWTAVDHLASQVHIHDGEKDVLCQTWILIPLNVEGVSTPLPSSGTLGSGPLPPYETGQSSAGTQHNAELTRDDFGTIVTEVTTITTSRRYRVPDA